MLKNYLNWAKRERPILIECKASRYEAGSLEINVNPEIAVRLRDGNEYAVKLWFNKDPIIGKRQADPLLVLIGDCLELEFLNLCPAIFDIRKGKFHKRDSKPISEEIREIIRAEATALGILLS